MFLNEDEVQFIIFYIMTKYSQVQTSVWGCEHFMHSVTKVDDLRVKRPLSFAEGYAVCSINIDTWKTLLTGDVALSLSRASLGDVGMDEVLSWRMEMHPNQVCAAYSRQSKSPEPIAFAVMLDSNFVYEADNTKYSQKTSKAFEQLQAFESSVSWSTLRASLKAMHSKSDEDCVRGNYRFNFGFAELACDKAEGFTGLPVDPSDGMFYPRISNIQYTGGEPCCIAIDFLVRLVGNCRLVLTSEAIPGFPGFEISYPLRFPMCVQGYNMASPLFMGLNSYVSGCDVMNRMSVCIFEREAASRESSKKMESLFEIKLSQRRFGNKFMNFANSRMHRDMRNTPNLQMFIVVSYKIPHECMCMMNLETNEHIVFCDPDESGGDGVKIFIFVGKFRDVFHGRVELDASWKEKCSPDAWMIRITPYTTAHAKKWNEKMNRFGDAYTMDLLRSLYRMVDSVRLGCTPDSIASAEKEKAALDFALPPAFDDNQFDL